MQAMLSSTFVDEVFGGKIASSITCLECQTVRHLKVEPTILLQNLQSLSFFQRYEILEDYLDLSLPVPADNSKVSRLATCMCTVC